MVVLFWLCTSDISLKSIAFLDYSRLCFGLGRDDVLWQMFFLKRIIHIWCVYDYSFLFFSFPTPMDKERLSMGKGNTMVELCSVEMAFSVCK